MAVFNIEYSDIKELIPKIAKEIKAELREELEQEVFIDYPKGLQMFLFKRADRATYQRVWELWKSDNFPRKNIGGIKGVYLSDLKDYENSNS